MSNQIIQEATDKVVDYMFREEDRHFREWIDEEDKNDPIKLMSKLKEHIFWSVIVLKYAGDTSAINNWYAKYWEENGEPDEEPEPKLLKKKAAVELIIEESDDKSDDESDDESEEEEEVIQEEVIQEDIKEAMKEFNELKYKPEEICTKSQWNGDWESNNAVLLILAEYCCSDKKEEKKCHINYDCKMGGSVRFNQWLKKYNFSFEWWNSCIVYVYKK